MQAAQSIPQTICMPSDSSSCGESHLSRTKAVALANARYSARDRNILNISTATAILGKAGNREAGSLAKTQEDAMLTLEVRRRSPVQRYRHGKDDHYMREECYKRALSRYDIPGAPAAEK